LLFSGYRHILIFGLANLVAVAILARLTVDGFASLWCGYAALSAGAIDRAAPLAEAVGRADLVFAEYDTPDQAGHDWGAASPQYRKAALLIDEEVQRLAAALDPTRSVLIVTSDHGHTPSGGHGGPEAGVLSVPLVLRGEGVRRGVRGRAEQVDVAPTVAALLGVPIPASSQGRTLVEALEAPEPILSDLRRSLCQERTNFATRYVALVSPATTLPAGECSARSADADRAASDAAVRAARQARWRLERRGRTAWALLFLLALLLIGWAAHRSVAPSEALVALAAGGLGLALYQALMPAVGLAYTFSALNDDDQLGAFFATDMALGLGVLVVLLLLVGFRYGFRPDLAWLATWDFAVLFVLRASLIYACFGVFVRWEMPDPVWGFVFYLDAIVVLAVGLSSPFAPLVCRLGGRFKP